MALATQRAPLHGAHNNAVRGLNYGPSIKAEAINAKTLASNGIFFDRLKETAFVCRDTLQGAAASVLCVTGAIHASAAELVVSSSEIFANTGLIEDIAMGRYMGFLELAIAAFLFLAARPGFARLIGPLAVFGYLIWHNSGLLPEDIALIAAEGLHELANRIDPTFAEMIEKHMPQG